MDELQSVGRGEINLGSQELFADRSVIKQVAAISQSERRLRLERAAAPFSVYLRVKMNGKMVDLLIGRSAELPESGSSCEYASYMSPKGSIASIPLGQERAVRTPSQTLRVVVLEKNHFQCRRRPEWDAIQNRYAALPSIVRSIPSLRKLVSAEGDLTGVVKATAEHEALEAELVKAVEMSAAERESFNQQIALVERQNRDLVTAMELRDQAILDEAQDQLFRIPISSRLVLTGAPGTGKTTVLIKRVAQKTRLENLLPEERGLLTYEEERSLFSSARSWVLFTPNDLLRGYLKEALAKELLPASESTVRTWNDQRNRLARDVFQFLKVGPSDEKEDKRRRFRRTGSSTVAFKSSEDLRDYLERFRQYRTQASTAALLEGWKELSLCENALEGAPSLTGLPTRSALAFSETASKVREVVLQLRRVEREAGVDEIAVRSLSPRARESLLLAIRNLEALFDAFVLDVGLAHPQLLARDTADQSLVEVQKRLRAQLVAQPDGQTSERLGHSDSSTPPASAEQTVDPVQRLKSDVLRSAIAAARVWNRSLRRLRSITLGHDVTLDRVLSDYGSFRRRLRRDKNAAARFFAAELDGELGDRINDQEIDLLLYVLLHVSATVFERENHRHESNARILSRVRRELRTIVTVDEAADFSWLQLGCMYYLSHPTLRSFSVSGDLQQRVTHFGLRDWDECREFAPDLQVHELRLAYRQSRSLLAVAATLYERVNGRQAPFESPLPEMGEPEPLLHKCPTLQNAAEWISERIVEVYRICDELPSIGVFVPEESAVEPMADALRQILEGNAIDTEACLRGRALGTGSRVRVFALEHIKGLEFQAVFLANFDQIAAAESELADKFLYVGLSRAVQFLAVTVKQALPHKLVAVTDQFRDGDWKSCINSQ